jgi:hypothetical protein
MIPRTKILLLAALLFGGACLIGVIFWSLHQRYIPPEAIEISRRFISLIESGDLREAYALTTQDSLSGSTFEAFEIKAKNRISQTVFVTHPLIQWVGVRGGFKRMGTVCDAG